MKEKLITKAPPIFTETYQRFQEHYWLYGSATVAVLAAGALVVHKLQERQVTDTTITGVQVEAEQIIENPDTFQGKKS